MIDKLKFTIFDIEVFKYDWIVVFKDYTTQKITTIVNDTYQLQDYLFLNKNIYVGFNNKHYDNYIIKAILSGWSNTEIKKFSDYIINDGLPWEYIIPTKSIWFNYTDLMDDTQIGTSLKSIACNLGMNVKESDVDFDIDRPLNKQELEQSIHYCINDVEITNKLFEIRLDYIETKYNLGVLANININKALASTNGKLVSLYLKAKRQEYTDGRTLEFPKELDTNTIPKEILQFFNQINDTTIDDETLLDKELNIPIKNCLTKYKWGGVHGSLKGYFEQATQDRLIINQDVASLYPSLIIQYNYLSRSVEDSGVYEITYHKRLKAKKEKDTKTDKALKLVLNTVSGVQDRKDSDLYDRKQAYQVRCIGQLLITQYVMYLIQELPSIKIINFNTDGVMYSVDKNEHHKIKEIQNKWQHQTRLVLEDDSISKVWVKDVNNLMFIKTDGKIKTVGGYLNYGINTKGAWSINNSLVVVKKALIEYFSKGTPIDEYINKNDNLLDFQIVSKVSSRVKETYHLINGKKVKTQKCNRVYATKNSNYGTLYRITPKGITSKESDLPNHCVIDNENKLTINDIDKAWYIKLAYKRLNDYKGIEIPNKTTIKKYYKKLMEI